ncbi:ABC transporter permease [Streptococcus sp. CSL10205-OR2]|uniref:ABC transporter permease n=1 Tax=Streptococcus sp. CSL10205-OR2 TaxID=2980558 RepID=UPI0021D8B676|nr:ABC transporter permease [Streptococcus sp. CSL10205-OR2]MCU9533328.1 ABC transporter permease [Streptococcus sp. CSL10205-OR2]
MFGKLIKYEIKSVGKWYFALYGAVLFCATILGLYISRFNNDSGVNGEFFLQGREPSTSEAIIMLAIILIFVSLIIGIGISTFFIIVNRFNKNIFGREGYLTLTLPVSTHQIILSKLLASFIWSVLSSIVLLFSIFLLVLPSIPLDEFFSYLPSIMANIHVDIFFIVLTYFIVATISSILVVYLAISIGQLFQDKRALMGFVAFFAIGILISIIKQLIFGDTNLSDETYYFDPNFLRIKLFFIREIFVYLVLSTTYYFGTHYIIKNKLNIQ